MFQSSNTQRRHMEIISQQLKTPFLHGRPTKQWRLGCRKTGAFPADSREGVASCLIQSRACLIQPDACSCYVATVHHEWSGRVAKTEGVTVCLELQQRQPTATEPRAIDHGGLQRRPVPGAGQTQQSSERWFPFASCAHFTKALLSSLCWFRTLSMQCPYYLVCNVSVRSITCLWLYIPNLVTALAYNCKEVGWQQRKPGQQIWIPTCTANNARSKQTQHAANSFFLRTSYSFDPFRLNKFATLALVSDFRPLLCYNNAEESIL